VSTTNPPLKLIVGLGNPGSQYALTRHNVGFWLVDEWARQNQCQFRDDRKFFGEVCKTPQQVWLLKPTTFMNRSGQAIAALSRFYRIPAEQILVIHDELDLPCGVAKLKRSGGHGGHNGLRDTISQLGSKDFLRLRMGIDHPGNKNQVSDYVLKPPRKAQQQQMQDAIDKALGVLSALQQGQLEAAMLQLHSK